ncbi:hypothetical protein NVP1084O_185 [Vibrio phage 1.084.O._10N.261.49.F5]|nr:hypothetical protein NVP1084O_185 [Vibrio phage 1.084.O._10N.261.49.F5]
MNLTKLIEKFDDADVLTTGELQIISRQLLEIEQALVGKGSMFKPMKAFCIQKQTSVNMMIRAREEK